LPFPRLLELVNLLVAAARAPNAVWPAMLEQELFAIVLSLEKGVQFAELDHAKE
jgi:hypothetical protein